MLPHIHILIGVISALFLKNLDFNNTHIVLFICGSLIPDIDIFISHKWVQNHRLFFTHFPLFWLSSSLIFLFLQTPFFWIFAGGFFHLLIDLIDWEVYFFAPLWMKGFSILKLDYSTIFQKGSIMKSLKAYYENKWILLTETIVILSLILILLSPN